MYFTSTATKQLRCIVCLWSKIENRVCELGTDPICADLIHSFIPVSICSLSSRPTMLASLGSSMVEAVVGARGLLDTAFIRGSV